MSLRKSPRLQEKCEQLSSAKKVKMNDDEQKPGAAAADRDDVASRLTRLLVQLNGDKPLDLTVTAAIAASSSSKPVSKSTKETMDDILLKLFVKHVGRSPDVVIQNAIDFMDDIYSRECDLFDEIQDRGGGAPTWACNGDQVLFDCPFQPMVKGPLLDMEVWLTLFLGKKRVDELLDGSVPLEKSYGKDPNLSKEHIIWEALRGEVKELSLCALMLNILSYIRDQSEKFNEENLDKLLRFAVMYGLDGVMKDILQSSYGTVHDDLNIDTMLSLSDEPLDSIYGIEMNWWMPALHFGAILGHSNIVLTAFHDMRGKIDAPFGVEVVRGDITARPYLSPSVTLQWVILKNRKEVLKTLVNDCGFQFRWIERRSADEQIFHSFVKRIFDLSQYESDPRWKGDIDASDYAYEGSRVRCQMRAAASFKEQMKMLDFLVDLGFPFELLFPIEPRIEDNLQTVEQRRDFMRNLTKKERAALESINMMASCYNSVQRSTANQSESDEDETNPSASAYEAMLTLSDYYKMLKSKWDGKESQVARMPEYESLDWTWREEKRRIEEGNAESSDDNDDDSFGDY